jgi:hypothetical protein
MCSARVSVAESKLDNEQRTLIEEEQYLLEWLERAAALSIVNSVEAISYEEATRKHVCEHCHSSRGYKSCHITGDCVCVDCGALLNGGRIVSCDDGRARAKHEREIDDYEQEHAEHANNANKDRARGKFQSYRRGYHFNERLAARQNHEPRCEAPL